MSQEPLSIAVKREGGKVILKFDRDVNYIESDPQNAIDIAEAMTAAAFEAMEKLKPVGETLKASLVEKHREKLIPRVALMLGSLREDRKKSDGQIAVSIIDSIFSEIFS